VKDDIISFGVISEDSEHTTESTENCNLWLYYCP